MKDYAKAVLSSPIDFTLAPLLEARLMKQAVEMYDNDAQRRGRSFESIMACCRKRVLEYAIASRTGWMLNPLTFDPGDPETYAYDLLDGDVRIECKSMKKKWLSGHERVFQTTMRNIDKIDLIVAGYVMHVRDRDYLVYPQIVIDPASFVRTDDRQHSSRFLVPSHESYGNPEGSLFYHDQRAAKHGYAVALHTPDERESIISLIQQDRIISEDA